MPPITVTHVLGHYPVYVEPGVLERLDALVAEYLPQRKVALIADDTVATLFRQFRAGESVWREAPTGQAPRPFPGEALTFPAGETSKTRDSWAALTDALLDRSFGRDSGIVALGGGVTGDLAGFVAATYMRGVPYIQVPTTLLAMLDASVGGKTGVDTTHGKNLIGAFHPPAAVLADPLTLTTLPEREYRSGLAEAIKHGLIADAEYFAWIERHAEALDRRDLDALTHLVRRSVEIKAEVVSDDERESGRRAILNAGHTIGHALEHVSHYALAHGEAVALGLVAECELAERMHIAPAGTRARVEALVRRLGLPARLPRTLPHDALLRAMAADKKNLDAQIRVALPSAVGAMHHASGWTTAASTEHLLAAISALAPDQR